MKRLLIMMTVCIASVFMTSCASYLSIESSRKELAYMQVVATKNPEAIKAFAIDGGAAIGIDVGNLDAIRQHPWRQLGAALVDAGVVYGAKAGIDALSKISKDDNDSTDSTGSCTCTISAGTVIINVEGTGNNINIVPSSAESPK